MAIQSDSLPSEGCDDWVVRHAMPDDAIAIATVHVRSWQMAYRGHMPDAFLDGLNVAQRAERWQQILSTDESVQWVATGTDGTVVGFASVMPSRDGDGNGALELAALYVTPALIRRGVGRLLMSAIDSHVDALAAPALTLWVLDSNAPARRFYEALGFASDGCVKLDDRFGAFTLRELRYRR